MDIVQYLRANQEGWHDPDIVWVQVSAARVKEAADEIERLREEYKALWLDHKRLRESLDRIASVEGGDVTALWKIMRDIARAALKEYE